MFENLVASRLSSFLDLYIDGFDKSKIVTSLGVWNGKLDLHDLKLRSDAFSSINIPLRILSGRIDHLHVTVPWVNLTNAAVNFVIDGIHIVADIDFSTYSKAAAYLRQKESYLDDHEMNVRKRRPGFDIGFAQRLSSSLFYNFHLEVNNVNIRIENRPVPDPFAMVFSLQSVVVQSTDDAGHPSITGSQDAFAYKAVSVVGLFLHWVNSENLSTSAGMVVDSVFNESEKPVLRPNYVVSPLSISALVRLTKPQPSSDVQPAPPIPRLLVQASCSSVKVCISDTISQQAACLAGKVLDFNRANGGQPDVNGEASLPNRPTVPILGNAKVWWRFIIGNHMAQPFSWRHIRSFRQDFVKYTSLFKAELGPDSGDPGRIKQLRAIESRTRMSSIVLMREIAERSLASDEEVQAQSIANWQRDHRKSWRSYISSFVFSQSLEGGVSQDNISSGAVHSLTEESDPSITKIKASLRFRIDEAKFIVVTSSGSPFGELIITRFAGDIKQQLDDTTLTFTIYQIFAFNNQISTSDRFHQLIQPFEPEIGASIDRRVSFNADPIIDVRLQRTAVKIDISVFVRPVKIIVSDVLLRLLTTLRPRFTQSGDSTALVHALPSVSVDVDLTSVTFQFPSSLATVQLQIGQISLSNLLDLSEDGPDVQERLSLDVHILDISLDSLLYEDNSDSPRSHSLLDYIPQVSITIEVSLSDSVFSIYVKSSLPPIRVAVSNEDCSMLKDILHKLSSTDVIVSQIEPQNSPVFWLVLDVELQIPVVSCRYFSSLDSLDTSLATCSSIRFRSHFNRTLSKLSKHEVSFSYLTVENCRIPSTTSEFSHWISISNLSNHDLQNDASQGDSPAFQLIFDCNMSSSEVHYEISCTIFSFNLTCDPSLILFASDFVRTSPTPVNPDSRFLKQAYSIEVQVSSLNLAYLIEDSTSCLFRTELSGISLMHGEICQEFSVDSATFTDQSAVAPQYANLIEKRETSQALIFVKCVCDPNTGFWSNSVQIGPVRWVLIPRFIFQLATSLQCLVGPLSFEDSDTENAVSHVSIELNEVVVLIPRDPTQNQSEYMVIDLSRLSVTSPDLVAMDGKQSKYQIEVHSILIRRASVISPVDDIVNDMNVSITLEWRPSFVSILCQVDNFVSTIGTTDICLVSDIVESFRYHFSKFSVTPVAISLQQDRVISFRIDAVSVNFVSSSDPASKFLCFRIGDFSATQGCVSGSTTAQLSVQMIDVHRGEPDLPLIILEPSVTNPAIEVRFNSAINSFLSEISLDIYSVCLIFDDRIPGSFFQIFNTFIDELCSKKIDNGYDTVGTDTSSLVPCSTSIIFALESFKFCLVDHTMAACLSWQCSVACFSEFSHGGKTTIDTIQADMSRNLFRISRHYVSVQDAFSESTPSFALATPFNVYFMADRQSPQNFISCSIYLPQSDVCASLDDIYLCFDLVKNRFSIFRPPKTRPQSLLPSAVLKDIFPLSRIGFVLDHAVFQIVDDFPNISNSPLLRCKVQPSSVEIGVSRDDNLTKLNGKLQTRILLESYYMSLDKWEPVIEWCRLEASFLSTASTLLFSVDSNQTVNLNVTFPSFDNLTRIYHSLHRLCHRDPMLSLGSPHNLRSLTIQNRTGCNIRFWFNCTGVTSEFIELTPNSHHLFEFDDEQKLFSESASYLDRRRQYPKTAGSIDVIVGDGAEGHVVWNKWQKVSNISLDTSPANEAVVHPLYPSTVADGTLVSESAKDDLYRSNAARFYIISHRNLSSLSISSPLIIRNQTLANFCVRLQSYPDRTSSYGQFLIPSGTDWPIPISVLQDSMRQCAFIIRPYGAFKAEFSTLLTFIELHQLPEISLSTRTISCPPGHDASGPPFVFSARSSQSSRKLISASVIILEPSISVINELPIPLQLQFIYGNNIQAKQPTVMPSDTVQMYHPASSLRLRLQGSSVWSEALSVDVHCLQVNQSVFLDASVEGSACYRADVEIDRTDLKICLYVRIGYWLVNRTGLDLFYGVSEQEHSHHRKSAVFRLCPGQNTSKLSIYPLSSRPIRSKALLKYLPAWADHAPWYAFAGPRRKQIETANPGLGLALLTSDNVAPHLCWKPSISNQRAESCSFILASEPNMMIGIRLCDSAWSTPFPIDSIVPISVSFQEGRPHCISGRDAVCRMYDLGVACCRSGSTTMVNIWPRYILHNMTRRDIQYRQAQTMESVTVKPGFQCAVHRYDSRYPSNLVFRLRQYGSVWSGAIPIDQVGTTSVRVLNVYNRQLSCILRINCTLEEATFQIHVYEDSGCVPAPYKIENFTFLTLIFSQENVQGREERVLPYHTKEFAWDEPMKSRRVTIYAMADGRSTNARHQYVGVYNIDRLCSDYTPVRLAGHDRIMPHSRELKIEVVASGPVRVLRIFDSMLEPPIDHHVKDHQHSFEVHARCSKFGISLIGPVSSARAQRRHELAYVLIDDLTIDVTQVQNNSAEVRVCAGALQLDNQGLTAAYPVVLAPRTLADSRKNFFDILVIKSLQQSHDEFHSFPQCSVTLSPFDLRLEESFMSQLMEYMSSLRKRFEAGQGRYHAELALPPSSTSIYPLALVDDSNAPISTPARIYCQNLSLSAILVHVSVTSSPVVNKSFLNPVTVLARAAGASLANLEDVPVRLGAVNANDLFGTSSDLCDRLVHQYTMRLVRSGYKLIASADVLGNPFVLLSSLISGVRDVIRLPLQGLVIHKSPRAFCFGLALGCFSLFRHVLFGMCNAASKFSSSIAKGISSLAIYNDDRLTRQYLLPTAIYQGIIGLALEPIKRHSTIPELYRATCRGVSGVVLLPLAATFRTLSAASEKVRALADNRSVPTRSRLPRQFLYGNILCNYDHFPDAIREFAVSKLFDDSEFVIGFVANSFFNIIVTSESIFVVNGSHPDQVLVWVSIRNIFSLTAMHDKRTLHIEMVEESPVNIIDTGSEENAKSVTKMFKYVRRRQRRLRHRK